MSDLLLGCPKNFDTDLLQQNCHKLSVTILSYHGCISLVGISL